MCQVCPVWRPREAMVGTCKSGHGGTGCGNAEFRICPAGFRSCFDLHFLSISLSSHNVYSVLQDVGSIWSDFFILLFLEVQRSLGSHKKLWTFKQCLDCNRYVDFESWTEWIFCIMIWRQAYGNQGVECEHLNKKGTHWIMYLNT